MEFVHPSFLYGLFAIAIPIVIHLFNFRKFKKIAFTNVHFLKEVKEETQSKSKLKHLLILLSRILAITFLVLAFSQPYVPVEKSKLFDQNSVSIFIDNSFSMDAEGENGRLLDVAKKYAIEIAENYSSTDKFQVVTNDFEGKHRHFFNKDEFIELVQDIETSPQSKKCSEVIQRQSTDLISDEGTNPIIYFISDFQKSITDLQNITADSTLSINFVSVNSNTKNNIYVDSVWFDSPVHQVKNNEKIHVKIVNTSDKKFTDIPLKLSINGNQKAISSFSISENEAIDSTLTFFNETSGIKSGIIEIQDYPITYDDKLFFSYNVADSIPVMYIFDSDTNKALKSILSNDNLFSVTYANKDRVNYAQITEQNLIILESLKSLSSGLIDELALFFNSGKSIFIIPPDNIDLENYRELTTELNLPSFIKLDTNNSKVTSINLEDEFYQNVFEKIPENIDLPKVKKHYTINENKGGIKILSLQNNDPFLLKFNGNGIAYLASCPLNDLYSNFTKHALFVPTIYKMALLSSNDDKLFYTIGKDNVLTLPNSVKKSTETVHITNKNNFDFIPEIRKSGFKKELFIHNQILKADNYFVVENKNELMGISFNYDKSESELATFSVNDLTDLLAENDLKNINVISPSSNKITNNLKELNHGKSYWKICIILTLIFLGVEVALIKFWQT